MPAVEDSAHLASDAELITSVRAGDREAFGDLYGRHASAAATLARQFARSPAEADDLVSEAFARVLDGLLEGKGPDTAFRAYLFTTIRNTAYDRTRRDKRLQFTDDIESHDQAVESDDPVIADLENGLVGRAFAGLPERWQTVLWHVQVEGQSPAEVGILMGMAPNAVSSLAFRAREGLREAYLQAHLAETAAQQCRTTVDRLGAWTRGGLSKRERAQVDAHLQTCDRCPALAAELSEINTSLRGLLAPLLLGGAAAGYVATLGPIAPLVQLGTFTGGATVAGSSKFAAIVHGSSTGARHAAGKVLGRKAALTLAKVGPWAPGAALAGAAAVTVGVVAAVVISLVGSSSAPVVAASQAPIPVAGSTVGGGSAVGGGGGSGGSTVGGGGAVGGSSAIGGSSGGGSSGSGGGSTVGGGNAVGGSTGGGNTVGAGSGSTVGGAGGGAGTTVGGNGGSGSQPVPVLPVTTGSPGGTTASGTPSTGSDAGAGTRPGGPGAAPTTFGAGVPGPGPAGATRNPPGTTPGAATGVTTEPTPQSPTADSSPASTTAPITTAPSTTADQTTADQTTAEQVTTTPTSDHTPVVPPPPTAPPTATAPTTLPAGPTTPTAPTTLPTDPSTPTIPVAPALLTVSASAAADAVAGSAVTVSVTVTNTGGSASAAGQSVVLRVPAGLSVAAVTPGSPLRTPHAFAAMAAAVAAPSCTQHGSDVRCALPPIAPQRSFRLDVTLDVSPDVADGAIVVLLNGLATDVHTIALTVQSGYAAVRLSSVGGLPLAPAAVSTVALVATAKTGVVGPGRLTVASPDFAVVGVSGDGGVCTVTAGAISCPATAVRSGITLDLAVSSSAAAQPVVVATDQRGRAVPTATTLTVDRSGIGGYRSVRIAGQLLRAGSADTVTMVAATLNPGVVDAGPITLPRQLSPGLRISARAGTPLPAGCVAGADAVACTPTDGAAARFALPVQVSAAATGPQQLADARLPGGTINLTDHTDPLTVDPTRSGYDRITLAAAAPLVAGTMATLRLDAVVAGGVTEPGPVWIARQLAPGLLVTATSGCDRDGEQFRCPPMGSGDAAPVLTVAVLPLAAAGAALAPARLDGGRVQDIVGLFTVVPRAPGQRISLTGPFGGRSIGAPTMRCETPGVTVRNGCPGGLTTIPASSASFTVPAGATVISAELTWAATAPAGGPANTLDTVDVSVDGTTPASVHGVRPAGVAADATGAAPGISGRLFQRVASADAQQLLAAGVVSGSHTVTISRLAARTTAGRVSAMGAWSLTVLWSTDAPASAGVITDNRGLFSSSTRAGAVTVIEPAGDPVTAIYQTIWAADPWSRKTLAIGGTALTSTVNGRHGNQLDGFDLLHPVLPDAGLMGAVTFTNRLTPPAVPHPDGLWIGPMLLITAPSPNP